jgi:prepilin-type N-terminal cleavage/methylation domain-containing protein
MTPMRMRRLHSRRTTNSRGFTLMELLVVLTIFSTVVVASTDIFLLANKSQRKIFGLEKAQADARFTLEAITREVRTGRIDYAYYAARGVPLAIPDLELALVDSANVPIRFKVSDAGTASLCANAVSTPCLLVTIGTNPPAAITPKGVAVRNVRFYVSPLVDPLQYNVGSASYASNEQPRVTVVMALETKGDRQGEQSVIYLQTTVTNRGYKR